MSWEKVIVEESAKIEDVPHPVGLCLVPHGKKIKLCGNMEILLEEVESKRLTSPYSLVSFTEFNKLLKKSKTGEIKLEGKKYKVFVPCPSNKFRVNEGDYFYVKKAKEFKTFKLETSQTLNTITIQNILSHLDCLDLVNAASVSKLWWNSAVSFAHGRQLIEVAPTVKAYGYLVSKSCITYSKLNNHYIDKAEDNFVSVLQKQKNKLHKLSEIIPDETNKHETNCKGKEEDEDEDENEEKEGESEEEEEEGQDEEEEEDEEDDEDEDEDEENDPDEWEPAIDIKLPTDLKECYKLSNGLDMFDGIPFKLYFVSLDEACDAERGEYGMYGCEKFLSGRSGYIHFGGEGEFAEFAINIDQHDPCYGYTYVFVNNLPDMSYATYSFSQFIIEVARMMKTPAGYSRLRRGVGSDTDLHWILERNEAKRKWKH